MKHQWRLHTKRPSFFIWLVTWPNDFTNIPFQKGWTFLQPIWRGWSALVDLWQPFPATFIRGDIVSYQVSRNHPFLPTVPLKFFLNVPKRFLLAAAELCCWAAIRKAATNWTLTTATSVHHAQSKVIAPVQRRTNQPDGPMPHLETIHWLKREQREGGDSRGRGQ